MKKTTLLALSILFLIVSCDNTTSTNKTADKGLVQTENQPNVVKPKLIGPVFSSDTAYKYIEAQLTFGPRVCNSPAHIKCGDYLVAEFRKFTDRVIEQKASAKNWDGKILQMRNIIASINPEATERVIIASHWDSRPYADNDPNPSNHGKAILAADDGASGVAVMLELARLMKLQKPAIGIDFVCFDAEDLGKSEHGSESYCLGSQYWSRVKHVPGYSAKYGILLDMVGAHNAKFVFEGYSLEYAEPILRKVWDKATQLGYTNYFYYKQGGYITDDHYFVNKIAVIPMIDIIHHNEGTSSRFPEHWHTVNDNINVISKSTLEAVGQTLSEVIYTD
jgi:Zn-dependent M28 family amino/carboxypeptidase